MNTQYFMRPKNWRKITKICDQSTRIALSSSLGSNNEGQNTNDFSLEGRDLLSLKHLKGEEIKRILWTAKDLKIRIKDNKEIFQPLSGKTAVLLLKDNSFKKELLSTELGLAKLGGQAKSYGLLDIEATENAKDTGREFSGVTDCIIASGFGQLAVDTLANESSSPVVSGHTDMEHPLQALAYLLTLQENFNYLMGCKVAWIGNGNAILNSLMYGCAKLGMDLGIATPTGREPNTDVMLDAIKIAGKTSSSIQFSNQPVEAVYRADAIITDPWHSNEHGLKNNQQPADFQGFELNRKMLKEAGANWVALHRLPRQHGETSDDIFYGKESLVWQAAENRMWVSMAVLLNVIIPYQPTITRPKFVKGE